MENNLESQNKLIADLGGPQAVARLLGLNDRHGRQVVQNWLTRGIPEVVWLRSGKMLLKNQHRILRKQAIAQSNIAQAATK
jgi:hypothetical protein